MSDYCRDWQSTLWPASYRGVPFFVERDSGRYGKRVHVHEYPNRETWYPEELGQKARTHRVVGYLASDIIDHELAALVNACTMPGSGELVLPLGGPAQAICLDVKTDRRKDRAGYIAVTLDFVEDPGLGPAPYPAPYYARRVGLFAEAALAGLALTFSETYATVDVAGFVTETSASTIRELAATIEDVRDRLPVSGEPSARLRALAQGLYDDADLLAHAGAAGDVYGELSWIHRNITEAHDLPARVGEIYRKLREAAAPDAAGEALVELAAFQPVALLSDATASRRRERDNVMAIGSLSRQAAIAEFAVTLAERDFATRSAAITARADIVEMIESEAVQINDSHAREGYVALLAVRDAAVEFLSRVIADVAPVIVVTAPAVLPATYWAWRLYGDAARGEELAGRNSVRHPGFMPVEFEALAR